MLLHEVYNIIIIPYTYYTRGGRNLMTKFYGKRSDRLRLNIIYIYY